MINKICVMGSFHVDMISYISRLPEASLISGIDVIDIDSAQYAAKKIYQKGVKPVVITLGGKGTMAYDGNNFIYSPVHPVLVRNIAGAGDALATSLVKGKTLSAAQCYVSVFSSLAVETKNASEMPNDNNVLYRMKLTDYHCNVGFIILLILCEVYDESIIYW